MGMFSGLSKIANKISSPFLGALLQTGEGGGNVASQYAPEPYVAPVPVTPSHRIQGNWTPQELLPEHLKESRVGFNQALSDTSGFKGFLPQGTPQAPMASMASQEFPLDLNRGNIPRAIGDNRSQQAGQSMFSDALLNNYLGQDRYNYNQYGVGPLPNKEVLGGLSGLGGINFFR